MTTKDRLINNVFFVLSSNGIDNRVYKALQGKKDYILQTFIKDERRV